MFLSCLSNGASAVRMFFCCFGLACLLTARSKAAEPVFINEFMAANSQSLADEDGAFPDWIELRNTSATAINLDGYYLTDDAAILQKWRLPNVNIPGNGYLVIFASSKDRTTPRLHTNFSLDADGEYLGFIKPDGVTIISEFRPEFEEQYTDFSYGYDAAGNFAFFSRGTPGAANGNGVQAFVADTSFSHDRGFYTAAFNLVITTETPNAQIRYTTNGVAPTATTGFVYAGPIPIPGTRTIRAAAYRTGFQPSNVDTQTYIFLDDVIRQAPTGAAPAGWPSSWGANTVNYGMDPDIVNSQTWGQTIKQDMMTLKAVSIVMDLNDLFNSSTGIYANPGQDGRAWERQCSIEFVHPDGTRGVQANAGIRIRGGFSRSTDNPKHAFRLFFREEYGDAKLRYPLFGDEGTDEFNNLDLRTFQNYSWSFQGDSRGVFIRDVFSRDTQLDMGHNAERGRYVHLYINGMYWGIYDAIERPEASYGETYFGGNKDNFDVVKIEAGPYTINATDGTMDAWNNLHNQAAAGLSTTTAYMRVQGRNPDGSPNPAYPNLIDLPNLIDYMLVILYGGNLDAPISNFLSNNRPNNWYGMRDRTGTAGFRFFAHDSEHTLLNVNEDRTGPYAAGGNGIQYSNPQYIWQQLQANPEFKLLVADHVHRHFFNNGALTPAAATTRFQERMAQLDRAVVGESARWGDSKREPAFTRDNWLSACNTILNGFFPNRSSVVLNQLRTDGLYPATVAPSFNQHGGNVAANFSLVMTVPAGNIYYTTDGSDPRLAGGAISPRAVRYMAPVTINESAQFKARALNGANWSAVNDATFTIIQTHRNLMISEVMYHPLTDGAIDPDDLEYIELKNTSNAELDLSGIRITNAINYVFPLGKKLRAGGFVVLARKPATFATRYPGVVVDGAYTNKLGDAGERIEIYHAAGASIATMTYTDQAPWPVSADGSGFSIVPRNPNATPNPSDPNNWRGSSELHGSPGRDDPPLNVPALVINEVLTHTDLPDVDSVEIHNPTTGDVDIGNWYLTDDRLTPKKFRIPSRLIPAGGYTLFTEADFNPTPGVGNSFTFSSHGDEVFLYSGDAAGNLTGYSDGFSFDAAANGVTFGRYVNSVGEILFPAQISPTPQAANSGPRVGPVVINEIRYQPFGADEEFVEVMNVSGGPVRLFDVENPGNTWRIDGIDFNFPPNIQLLPGEIAVVTASTPDAFRARNGVPQNVQVFGPFTGTLQDNGETLRLQRPDSPDVVNGQPFVPMITVDEVRYSNQAPWPLAAGGSGPSLEKLRSAEFGNDPNNWRASPNSASPGLDNMMNRAPTVNAGPDQSFISATFPLDAPLSGAATDDGQPAPPRLTYQWSHISGPGVVQFANPQAAATTAGLPGTGVFVVRLTVSDGSLSRFDDVELRADRPTENQPIVDAGARWSYLDNGSNQGTAWRAPEFDDTAWAAGNARLGYGDTQTTRVSFGPNASDKYRTTYFRHTFNVASLSGLRGLLVRLQRDDGAIVYLNGTEVMRNNMPEGTVTYTTFASSVVDAGTEYAWFDQPADPALLRVGANVLAVEVHQINASSSDLGMDLQLIGAFSSENTAPILSAGPDLAITLPNSAMLQGSVIDDGLPSPPGAPDNLWTKVSGPGTVTFENARAPRTRAEFSMAGTYVLQLATTDGQFSAQDTMTVEVAADNTYANWRAQHFNAAELADQNISGDTADPDGDDFVNYAEFVAGTDPRDPNSFLGLGAELLPTATALRFTAMPGITYELQYRDQVDQGPWLQWRGFESSPNQTPTEVQVPTELDQTGVFFRLITPRP